jgi:hypothetical protein
MLGQGKLPRKPIVAVIAGTLLLALTAAASASARVLTVIQRHVSYPHYTTIQAAVNAAHRGDWIVIAPGVYARQVRIKTPGLHLRGMNRNTVILDGQHHVGNGITVTANGVWVENLTVRNFDRRSRDDFANGNEVWWMGGGPTSATVGIHGWWGQYLTAYDTGLLGGYGLFASHSVDGFLKHVYASGFNDSGLYVGACRDCQALVQDALIERNGLGWSSTNAGGHLIVEDSIFRNNSIGVAPNSEPDGDKPPPQDGACDSGSNRSATPTFTTTQIRRCTIFRNNVIENNGNLSTPADADILGGPWGAGVVLPGDYADLIENNTIRNNPTFGVLVFERPDPYPPTSDTVFFQAAGNRVSNNRFSGNATAAGTADIGLEGGAFPPANSVNNCFSGNAFTSSIPAGIEGTWGCQNATTPNGGVAVFPEILNLIGQSGARHQRSQPVPARQPTMPQPCREVPKSPLCA